MTAVKKQVEAMGSNVCANHDYDLVHDLKHRLDAIWHYDQHIANARGHEKIQQYWMGVKQQDEDNIKRLKSLIGDEISRGCF
jgi:hypothetical protein